MDVKNQNHSFEKHPGKKKKKYHELSVKGDSSSNVKHSEGSYE